MMNNCPTRTSVTHLLLLIAALASAACVVGAPRAFCGEPQPAAPGATNVELRPGMESESAGKAGVIPGEAPGMIIFVDPQTGAVLKEPAPGTVPLQLSPALQNALSTSGRGLAEVPSSVPGGGVMLELQGRFQSPLFITIDAEGQVRMQHIDEMTAPAR